ncbi:MAG: hypothetical protein RIR62_18 [Pseudomonadota bacterium]
MSHHADDDPPEGFAADLPRLMGRRMLLGGLAATGAAGLFWATRGGAETIGTAADGAQCVALPAEMAGPFPADGTNVRAGQVVNILTEAGVIRDDIRDSIGGLTPVAAGVPMVIDVTLVDVRRGCAPLAGMALYAWQCDAAGIYSIYEAADRNYLRGVGISDAAGRVRLVTVVPGTYPGRWPHIHFEVFASPERAVTGGQAILTSQFALPEAECRAVYGADRAYARSIPALADLSLSRDRIFRNGTAAERAAQMMRMTGDLSRGLTATAQVGLLV